MKKNALYAQSGGVTAVINATAGALILEARKNIFNLINQLAWDDGFYRKDIGYKVIDE